MTPWHRACTALALMAVDPVGLGGITVKGRSSPARDAFTALIGEMDPNRVKLHPAMANDALDGTLDIAATLRGGTIVQHAGLLACHDRLFTLSMAERTAPYLAARLAMALDAGEMRGLIAFDEGIDDEKTPDALADRLAFCVTLDDIPMADLQDTQPILPPPGRIEVPADLPEQLVVLAVQLGIHSLRAPSFALRAACAHAILMGRKAVIQDDIVAAVELVLAHRATQLPQKDTPPPEPEQPDTPPAEQPLSEDISLPDDMLLEAVLSALPKGLLDKIAAPKSKSAKGSGSGRKITGSRRGRPLPARDITARANTRIDLIATLRAAIPWQTLRKAAQPDRTGPIIQPADLRAKRYQHLSDRVLIFAVDASGSAAIARLNEAKGAIEILLSEAYARRDHVALIAFRGSDAEILLSPTRSLVQTKRRLASLPGGGGTPLAAGLLAALDLSQNAQKRGQTPTIIVLTDGRSNVALDGSPNRKQASEDAIAGANSLRSSGCDSIVIDTSIRPNNDLKSLADLMGGHYIPLPRADAKRVSAAVSDSLRD